MKAWAPMVVALLLGSVIFSSYKYFSSIPEKYELLDNVQRTKTQVVTLEHERANLTATLEQERAAQKTYADENVKLHDQLRVSQESQAKMESDLQASQKTLEDLNNEFSAIKAENAVLSAKMSDLQATTAAAQQAKAALQAKLSSLAELRKAINELNRKLSVAKPEINTRLQDTRLLTGNDGYMIKEGKSTFPTRIKIEVVPLPEPGGVPAVGIEQSQGNRS